MFCTLLDVRTALTPGASDADKATASGLADWQILDAIEEATGVVKMYLARRYTIPEPETEYVTDPTTDPVETDTGPVAPYPVRAWARNIAAWLATLTFKQNKDVAPDDPIRLRLDMTMAALVDIRDGKSNIGLDPIPVDGGGGVWVGNLYNGKLFSLEDFDLVPIGVLRDPQVLWPSEHW